MILTNKLQGISKANLLFGIRVLLWQDTVAIVDVVLMTKMDKKNNPMSFLIFSFDGLEK